MNKEDSNRWVLFNSNEANTTYVGSKPETLRHSFPYLAPPRTCRQFLAQCCSSPSCLWWSEQTGWGSSDCLGTPTCLQSEWRTMLSQPGEQTCTHYTFRKLCKRKGGGLHLKGCPAQDKWFSEITSFGPVSFTRAPYIYNILVFMYQSLKIFNQKVSTTTGDFIKY